MRKVFIGLLAACLAACGGMSGSTAVNVGATVLDSVPFAKPIEMADKTNLDEKIGFAVEVAYSAWRTSVEIGVDSGAITGARATWAREMDVTLYRLVLKVRRAYWTANAESYQDAVAEANELIEAALAQLNSSTS